MNSIELRPIGYVRTEASEEQIKIDRRNVVSTIILSEGLKEVLDGIEGFSHLFVIYYMHKISEEAFIPKVHPSGRSDLPVVGIFATRSGHRPNPIGLTLVKLLRRRENVLEVRGLDALDGTPILDIKPYDPIDSAQGARVPDWWLTLHPSLKA